MITPHSLYHLARKENLMTDEERAELLADGWQPEIVQELAARGFRPCQPERHEVVIGCVGGFLRQTVKPHLHITVERDEFIEVVRERIDTAIYDAGYDDGHDCLASAFERFTSRAKARRPRLDPEIADLKDEVAKLKAKARKATVFFDPNEEYRGIACTCGFTASTGDRAKDEAAIAAHTCL